MENEMEKDFDARVEDTIAFLKEKAYVNARDELLKNNEVDIAEILEELSLIHISPE